MQKFDAHQSTMIPLMVDDIDTDQIIPARYLKVTDKSGLADGLFHGWRYGPDGSPNDDFPFNREEYVQAQILLAGDNFGCGSSREHAPWALIGRGIRAVISTSFADIFKNNAMKNGLLPVVVDAATHRRLFELAQADPTAQVKIELASQTITLPDGTQSSFPIDAFNKTCMLEGLDALQYLLRFDSQIAEYEQGMP